MPTNARAALVRGFDGTFSIEQIQIDDPQGAEVLIEVRAVGLCQSDAHLSSIDLGIPAPLLMGHEISGIITKVGEQAAGLKVGDHVVATLIQYCAHCTACRSGEVYRCERREHTLRAAHDNPRITSGEAPVTQMFGTGGFAQYALVHAHQVVKIPKNFPFPQAAVMACSTLTGAGAVFNTANVGTGDSVAVIGAGGIGLNAINAARIAGAAKIIAVDLADEKLDHARRFGATHTINGGTEDAVATVRELTGGGVDHAFEMIGLAVTSAQAIRMTRVAGDAYLVGLHKPGAELVLDAMADIIQPQRTVHGIYMGSSNPQRDIPRYVEHYLAGRLELDALVAREMHIDQINEGFETMKNGAAMARSVITSFS
ncbi:zinc-binding dehydrogenase [Glutamicibacter arilaitensis]|uniref:zinc-binding dehydrogenase n=1 Tax=Glutamicibacter arilaitensis TaxID=256701 RepID=UPI0038515D58